MTTKRKCGNCAYYERAPLRGKGWCRNRDLFKSSENHLVEENEYSCFKTFGSHWEPAIVGPDSIAQPHEWRLPTDAERAMMDEEEAAARAVPPRREVQRLGGLSNRALAVVGAVLLVVVAFFVVRAVFFSDAEGVVAQNTPTATVTSTPTAQPTSTPSTPNPTPTLTAVPTITVGVKAQVTNTSAAGLKLRDGPSTESTVVRQLSEGAFVDVVGGPAEAAGHTWWQISIDGDTGWCAADWLTLVTTQP